MYVIKRGNISFSFLFYSLVIFFSLLAFEF